MTRNIDYVPISEKRKMWESPIVTINKYGVLIRGFSLIDNDWKSFYSDTVFFYEVYDKEGDTL